MATVRNRRLLTGLNEENYEERLKSNLVQNSIVPRLQEVYTPQVFEEIEGRVPKKFSPEFIRT